jgi:hypothetical protein
MRLSIYIVITLLILYTPAFAQSALEVQGGHKSASFEHWYYTSLDVISPRLEFFNYTNAIWYHSDNRPNATLVNPFLGYNFYKGIGITASITFQNEQVSPFLGLQYSKSTEAHNLYSVISYSPSNTGMAELFFWYLYQPINEGWKPFGQFNIVSNVGSSHNFTQLRFRLGPSYKSHAFGLAWDADWDTNWNMLNNLGLFYRFQLQ